jgi:cytidylate kinase
MISFSAFRDELIKIARVVVLSGGAGAGKTSLSRRLGDQFDKVVHGDTWGVRTDERGNRRPFDKTPEQKEQIFFRRMREVRRLNDQGKDVLVEGVPNVIIQHPGLVNMADEVIHIDVPYTTRVRSIIDRTKTQNDLQPTARDVGWILREHLDQIRATPILKQQAGDRLTVLGRDESWKRFGLTPPTGPIDVGRKIR